MKTLLSSVLKKVRPPKKEKERQEKTIAELTQKIRKAEGRHLEVVLAGSIARDTHLKGDNDIDLFVMFPRRLSREEFAEEGLKIGKKVLRGFEWEEAYSEHPYVRGKYKGFDVEIVPSYKVEKASELKSAVDRTPFHTKFLEENLKERQKDEVRLLRQFLKGIKCYGADIKCESFPGYITELLIVNYGSFLNALKNVGKWRKGEVIDLKKHYTEQQARKRFGHHLIIVDPTDRNRNVASALSFNQFSRFVAAANAFLGKPSRHFFFGKKVKPWGIQKVRKELGNKEIVAVRMRVPKKVHLDVIWGQLKRLRRKMGKKLELNDFRVQRAEEWSDEQKFMCVVLELENAKIQRVHKHFGPEVTDLENSAKFFGANKSLSSGPRIENGRWVVEKKRKYWNAFTLLKDFIKNERVKSGKEIKKALSRAKVLNEKELLEFYKKSRPFAEFFTFYLKGKEEFADY